MTGRTCSYCLLKHLSCIKVFQRFKLPMLQSQIQRSVSNTHLPRSTRYLNCGPLPPNCDLLIASFKKSRCSQRNLGSFYKPNLIGAVDKYNGVTVDLSQLECTDNEFRTSLNGMEAMFSITISPKGGPAKLI